MLFRSMSAESHPVSLENIQSLRPLQMRSPQPFTSSEAGRFYRSLEGLVPLRCSHPGGPKRTERLAFPVVVAGSRRSALTRAETVHPVSMSRKWSRPFIVFSRLGSGRSDGVAGAARGRISTRSRRVPLSADRPRTPVRKTRDDAVPSPLGQVRLWISWRCRPPPHAPTKGGVYHPVNPQSSPQNNLFTVTYNIKLRL